ncbi:MAG: hypothetical protein GY861_18790 [bacterium]|nr:hypothetical protein [bacterium]
MTNKTCSNDPLGDLCDALLDRLGDPASYCKGLNTVTIVNLEVNEPKRVLPIYRSKAREGGTVLNFCPFCGTDLKMRRREVDRD